MRDARFREWLEADGLGGFASGTVSGIRTRRYHALLLAATTPPTGRVVLVNGFDAWVETPAGAFALSSQRYAPDVDPPRRRARLAAFTHEPWPRWTFTLRRRHARRAGAARRAHGQPRGARWRLRRRRGRRSTLERAAVPLRPRLPRAAPRERRLPLRRRRSTASALRLAAVPGVPAIVARIERRATRTSPTGIATSCYAEERARGLDDVEDLASPGDLALRPRRGRSASAASAAEGARSRADGSVESPSTPCGRRAGAPRAPSRRRSHRAADAYLVRRGAGRTIVAGYPWFTDWGRDTFIALRGLCLATGRLDDAREILLEWAGAVSEGMLPNRFPDRGETPEFNAVDASLWFVVAVARVPATRAPRGRAASSATRDARRTRSTRSSTATRAARATASASTTTACSPPASPACSSPGWTRKVGDWVVTPRIGKPVEVQALWLNALRDRRGARRRAGSRSSTRAPRLRSALLERGARLPLRRRRRRSRAGHGRRDVPAESDLRGRRPAARAARRRARARGSSTRSRRACWTPLGLRSLAPDEPGYAARYAGRRRERDGAYHQGTVWPWLLGPFVEAWVRVRGGTAAAAARGARALPRAAARASRRGRPRPRLPRSPTATRRTRRAAVRSRPGRWASCCACAEVMSTARRMREDREATRLAEDRARTKNWQRWGRIWRSANGARCARTTPRTARAGTSSRTITRAVRAYRWGEDGLLGICDRQRGCASRSRSGTARPDPEGAAVRPHRPRRQPRRGRQGVLLLSRRDADALLPEGALQVSAGRVPLRATRDENRARGKDEPSSSSPTPAYSTRVATST